MRQNNLNVLLLALALAFAASQWSSVPARAQGEIDTTECLETFETFAYGHYSQSPRVLEPSSLSSWQRIVPLPPQINQDFPIFNQVSAIRMTENQEEVWITGNGVGLAVYNVNQQEWDLIPRTVYPTGYVVGQLFVAPNGVLWGQNIPIAQQENPEFEDIPLLSRFNETTNRFEIPADTMQAAVLPQRGYFFPYSAGSTIPHVLVDNTGIFWIIVSNDGIYRFDPVSGIYDKQASLDFPVGEAALSADDSLYLWTTTQIPQSATFRERLTMRPNSIWHYSLESRSFALIDLPDRDWPMFHGMLVNQTGQLWLGAIGFRDTDYTWHLIHTNADEYLDNAGNYRWGPPQLLTESSDGRLWYVLYTESAGDGTAWYDPQSGEGCLIMNYTANIVEDTNRQLWMVAGGYLYRQ